MFYQLSDVSRIQSNLSCLSQSKQTLQQKYLSSFSSNQKNVQQSFHSTLNQIIKQNQYILSILNSIDDQVQTNYFVPNQINIEQLVYQYNKLPEWFSVVFQKEYDKQKCSIDMLCKKMYKMQSLNQVKQNFERQAHSFKLLTQRYIVLEQKQKTNLNIMSEAEIIKNKCQNTKQKYQHFCIIISQKILSFLQQTISKSINFSNSMNTIGSNVINSSSIRIEPQRYQKYQMGRFTNKFKQTLSHKFKQTTPNFEIYQNQRGFDPRRTGKSTDFYARSMNFKTAYNFNNRYPPTANFNNTLSDFYH